MEKHFQDALSHFCCNGKVQSIDDLRSDLLKNDNDSVLELFRLKNHLLQASKDLQKNNVVNNALEDDLSDSIRFKWENDFKMSNPVNQPAGNKDKVGCVVEKRDQIDDLILPPCDTCGLAFIDGTGPCNLKVDNFFEDEEVLSGYTPSRGNFAARGKDNLSVLESSQKFAPPNLLKENEEVGSAIETGIQSHDLRLPLEKMGITYGAHRTVRTNADIFLEHYISQIASVDGHGAALDEFEIEEEKESDVEREEDVELDGPLPHRAQRMLRGTDLLLPGAGERNTVEVEAFDTLA